MSADGVKCPACASERVRYREHRNDWFCDDCDHRWPADAGELAESILKRTAASGTAMSGAEQETLIRQLASTGQWERLYSMLGP